AYRKAFPDLFTSGSKMPAGLRSHLRYPQDLFRVQTTPWGRHHPSTPSDWDDSPRAWPVAAGPRARGGQVDTSANSSDSGAETTVSANTNPIPPYYQLLRLPEEPDAEFLLMRPFVPKSEGAKRQQLTAFMVARMDPGHYGQLGVYEMPSGQ